MRVNGEREMDPEIRAAVINLTNPDGGAGIELGRGFLRFRGNDGEVTEEYRWPTGHEMAQAGYAQTLGGEEYPGEKFCLECGGSISTGALYCQMDAPYGLMHWLRYFSPAAGMVRFWKAFGADVGWNRALLLVDDVLYLCGWRKG